MEIENLSIFIKDISASATNKGFLYQYLHTLYEWLNKYIFKSDAAIYCEYGDDIAIETEKSITFKQVKHYTEKLNLNSSAIKKTLFNCFILYIKYFEYIESVKDTMFFIVSNVESKDPIIKNWEFYKKKSFNGYEDVTIEKVKSLVIKKIEIKKTKSLSDKRLKKEVSKEKHAKEVNLQYTRMMDIVNNTDWFDFCSRLTFLSNNDTIESLKGEIFSMILRLNIPIPGELIFARLLQTIIEESCKDMSEKNKLNRSLLDCILKESQKEMSERIIVSYDVFKELYDELIGPDLEGIKSIIEQNHEISKKTYAKTDKIDEKTDEILSLLTELASKKEIGKEATISNIPHRDINMNERVLHERTLTCDKLFEIVDERINNFINDGKFYEAKEIIDKILDSTSFSDYPLYFTDSLKQKLGVIFLNTGDIEKAKRVLEDLVKSSTRNKNICIFMVTMAAIIKDEQLKNSAIHQLKELGENEDGIKLSLCKYYNILGEFEKALEIITQNNNIKDCYKENAHALELMGDILFRTERYSENRLI
jgi:tetratricopeptide (TPR) repeat protein